MGLLQAIGLAPRPATTTPEPVAFRIPAQPIRNLFDPKRRNDLLRLEGHLRGTQHAHKSYDWEANLRMGDSEIPVGGYVSMRKRRPCVSLRLGKVITKRLTTMVCGHDRFPTICIEGDETAEDYVRELAKAAKLRTKMIQARNKGGAVGSVVLSWGFANGKPVITVHSAALIEVLEWRDYEARIPARVLKIYDHKEPVFKDGKRTSDTFWFVRYWDENVEVTWRAISEEAAKEPSWVSWPHETVVHNLGACPVVWIQNISDDEDVDGQADADGQHEDLDEIDRLASATERGTILNVDPTLVIHDKKGKDEAIVRKGSGQVIYSPQGAEYLELNGTAVEASSKLLSTLQQHELDEAEVVLLDPEKVSGLGMSAAALMTVFAPMLAKCDLLRDQYGEAIVGILKAMLEASRRLREVKTAEDGTQTWSRVELEPRIERVKETEENEDGDEVETDTGEVRLVEREPGSGSNITLKWPPYFPATWADKQAAITAVTTATKKPVLSRLTAVAAISSAFDIEDPQAEVDALEDEEEEAAEKARSMLEAGAPLVKTTAKDAEYEEQDNGEEEDEGA